MPIALTLRCISLTSAKFWQTSARDLRYLFERQTLLHAQSECPVRIDVSPRGRLEEFRDGAFAVAITYSVLTCAWRGRGSCRGQAQQSVITLQGKESSGPQPMPDGKTPVQWGNPCEIPSG
jgi:hypothetical protein